MKKNKWKTMIVTVGTCTMLGLTGCAGTGASSDAGIVSGNVFGKNAAGGLAGTDGTGNTERASGESEENAGNAAKDSSKDTAKNNSKSSSDTSGAANETSGTSKLNTEEMFTDRDLVQTADLSDAETITVSDGKDVQITKAGVYVLTGTASDVTVYVEAGDEDKVQLVLNGVSITNQNQPCIYVKSGDKVFVTTTDTENSLSVTGSFASDGTTHTDGVIFSKSDLVLNGTGTLAIQSSDHGVVCKDDLKITGGTWQVTAASKAFDANDSIRIADGTFEVTAGTDGLHAENSDDSSKGYIYIGGGTFTIQAGDDAIHAVSVLEVDGGTYNIAAAEGMEATVVQINDGTVNIQASDDGINAANKSSAYSAVAEFNGGEITVVMGAGDTDGIDSNGDVIVNGGTISVTGNSSFDYDGSAQFNGGTIIVNGQQVDTIPNQMMGGGMRGGMRGGSRGNFNRGADSGMGNVPGENFNGSPDSGMGNVPGENFNGNTDSGMGNIPGNNFDGSAGTDKNGTTNPGGGMRGHMRGRKGMNGGMGADGNAGSSTNGNAGSTDGNAGSANGNTDGTNGKTDGSGNAAGRMKRKWNGKSQQTTEQGLEDGVMIF